MDKEYLQSLYTPEQQLLLFGDANYFNNQNNDFPFVNVSKFQNKGDMQTIIDQANPNFISPTYLMKQQLGMVPTGITASSAAIPFGSPTDIAQGFVEGSPSDASFPGTNFQFLPSANEADEIDEVKERKGGIAELFAFLANFIPGVGLLKKLSDSSGIRSLNQRIQQSDFGRSKNLMDYLDIKSYGGYDEREEARKATMDEARDIRKKIDRGDYNSTSSRPDRTRSSVTRSSAAKSKGVGGGGYTKSDSTRDSYRGRY